MKATCIDVYYVKGEFGLGNGVSGKKQGQVRYADEGKYTNIGNGWESYSKASQLILEVELESGNEIDVHIGSFFKDELGTLTPKRRDIIKQTMPEIIKVSPREKASGGYYFIPSMGDLKEWLKRVNTALNQKKSKSKLKK